MRRKINSAMIKTIKELKRAFVNQSVDEVSPNLILNSPQPKSLYPTNMEEAWVHSSAGIYNLLNINARYGVKKKSDKDYNERKKNNILDLNPLTIYAAQRGVGFDFGVTKSEQTENDDIYPPQPRTAQPNPWVVFDLSKGPFETLSGLPTQEPVKKHFHKFAFQKAIPTQHVFEQQILDLVSQLKPDNLSQSLDFLKEASDYLQQQYADNKRTPVQIAADLFGVQFPYYFNLASQPGVKKGSLGFPTDNIDKSNQLTNYKITRSAISTLPSPSDDNPNYMVSANEAMRLLYDGFLAERIDALKNIPKRTNEYNQLIKEIAIGLRVFQASNQLQSSPLNTGSNGAGYSNAANPLVGKTYQDISIPSAQPSPVPVWQLDSFSGQEYLIDNIIIPKSVLHINKNNNIVFDNPKKAGWLALTVPPSKSQDSAKYTEGEVRLEAADGEPKRVSALSEGWFNLHKKRPIPEDANGSGIKKYKHHYEITDDSKKHAIYDTNTLSSDTITAVDLKKAYSNTLKPSSIVSYNNKSIPLVEINPLIKDLLPSKFSTYFATAGGVDRISGSDFTDIIIGPDDSNKHGTLRFDAGAGDDIVSPGRGGSIGLLGGGKDKLVIGTDNLFGQTIILDFNAKSDTVHIEKGIHHKIDQVNPSLCLFFPKDEKRNHYNTKSILLASESSPSWENISISKIV